MPKFLPPNLSNNAELCILRYTTSDNEMLDIAKRWSGAIHTCNNGEWVVTFNEPIRMIGWEAFYGCSSLTSITIPSSVTEIEEGAFRQCCSLTSVTIPNSVTKIGNSAFDGCSSLTSVTIPNSVTKIGTGVFFRCSSLTAFYGKFASADNRCLIVDGVLNSFAPAGLTKYTIPNSVTKIEEGAFRYCISLTNVTIPNSVTKIGSGAFAKCISLTNVTIPNSVTEIESGAFDGCIRLTAFYGKFASADNRCLIVDGVLNSFAPAGLTKYTIPNSVTVIGHDAFSDCSSLTSVTIPNSVTEIGNRAFSNCSSLTSVHIPNSVTKIESGAFDGCSSSIRFYGKFASYDNRYLIGDGVIDTYNLSSRMTSGIFHKEEE